MFKAKELAGPPESSLHLIEDQQSLLCIAPLSELLNVLFRAKARSPSLVSLQQNSGDVARLDMASL
jgi:hypothetical protein